MLSYETDFCDIVLCIYEGKVPDSAGIVAAMMMAAR
jgi:hypothetical protein